jgi:uncharacterized membrane protein YuzA (DUF378 family)
MNNLFKRIAFGGMLGAIFGFLCFLGFVNNPNLTEEMLPYTVFTFSNPMLWQLIVNRFLIGVVVGIAGVITFHPWFNFKIPAFLRGFKMGIWVSLTLSIGVFFSDDPNNLSTFFMLTIAGGIIGLIIDLIVTKLFGEGEDLTKK